MRAGKARYIGASSMFAWQFAKAQHVADELGMTRFVSMQNHYNLIYREEEREMVRQCVDQGRNRSWPSSGPGRGDSRFGAGTVSYPCWPAGVLHLPCSPPGAAAVVTLC